MNYLETKNGQILEIADKLLSPGTTNSKLIKNRLESHILYLLPSIMNSKKTNLCPGSTKECVKVCIESTGRGVMAPVKAGRRRRTELYIQERNYFLNMLMNELAKLNKKAERKGKKIAIRLNGTSDLDFIAIIKNRFDIDILDAFKSLEFYDYTKLIGKVRKYAGTSYKLTYSRSGLNDAECLEALSLGASVSVVFDDAKPFPQTYFGAPVYDGDSSDDLMLDIPGGSILGLKAKGKARKNFSEFIVR
jgi:hypothetical protein